jgi:hypothetical protein
MAGIKVLLVIGDDLGDLENKINQELTDNQIGDAALVGIDFFDYHSKELSTVQSAASIIYKVVQNP